MRTAALTLAILLGSSLVVAAVAQDNLRVRSESPPTADSPLPLLTPSVSFLGRVQAGAEECIANGESKSVGKQLCNAMAEYAAPGYAAKKAYDLHRFSNTAELSEVEKVVKGNLGTALSEKQIASLSKDVHSKLTSKTGRYGSLVIALTLAGKVVVKSVDDLPAGQSPVVAVEKASPKPSSIASRAAEKLNRESKDGSTEQQVGD